MNYRTVQLEYDGGVATITLNRPEKRNAISFELIEDLLRALADVAKSEAIILIVTDRQGFLFGNGSGQSESVARTFSGTELARFADDGPAVSLAV